MARPAPHGLDGPTIRRLRQERRWTQTRFVQEICATADELGRITPAVTTHMVSKWENGRVGLSDYYAELVEATFARTMKPDSDPGRYDMDRRRFLSGATTVGAMAFASTLGMEPWQRLSSTLQRRTRIDSATVENLETMTRTFSELFLTMSPVALLGPARSHLDTITQLLGDGSIPDHLRRRIASLAGESSILMGWLMQDQGDEAVAQEFYLTALDAAEEASDRAIGAYAIASASTLEAFRSSPAQSVHLLTEATVKGSSVADATPSTKAWAYSLVAEAHTRDGNVIEALAALDTAHAILESGPDDEPRPRAPFFDHARLAGERGVTSVRLELPDEAERSLVAALSELGDDPKSLSRILTNFARARLQQDDIETACTLAAASLDVAQQTGSNTGVRDVYAFRRQLGRWRDTEAVQDLDNRLMLSMN